MTGHGKLVGIVLAAGRSRRFGSDKLLHPLADGTPMALACATALRAVVPRTVAVIKGEDAALAALFAAHGIETTIADQADSGMGASLAAGIAATTGADGWLVALGDMPYIQPQTIGRVASMPRRTQLSGAARTSGGVILLAAPGTAHAAW
jgi:molybdenum cofactor cytidylyltransferase